MYGCESWTIKKVESQRNDAFELWCWRRLLRVPWTANRSNQSIVGGLMLKLKLQYFWPLDAKTWLIGKGPDTKKDRRQEEKGVTEEEMVGYHHRLDGHGFEKALGVGDGQDRLVCCSPWSPKELDMAKWLKWTEIKDDILQKTKLWR